MKLKHCYNICTKCVIMTLYMCVVNCISQIKNDKEDNDYYKIVIGKELLDLELFNDEELVSVPDQRNFNAIDHFMHYDLQGKDQLIGFEDDFKHDNKVFIHEYE